MAGAADKHPVGGYSSFFPSRMTFSATFSRPLCTTVKRQIVKIVIILLSNVSFWDVKACVKVQGALTCTCEDAAVSTGDWRICSAWLVLGADGKSGWSSDGGGMTCRMPERSHTLSAAMSGFNHLQVQTAAVIVRRHQRLAGRVNGFSMLLSLAWNPAEARSAYSGSA